MAGSLLGSIEEYLSSDVIQRASQFLGESPANTEKAVQSAVPALLGSLIQRAQSTEGAEAVLGLITRARRAVPSAEPARLLDSPASLQQAASSGSSLLTSILGGKLDAVTDLLATSSGIKSSSASSLLGLLTPLLLSIIGREATTRGGGPAGLMSLLASQKSEIMSFLPSGLTGLVQGLGTLTALTSDSASIAAAPQKQIADTIRDAGARLGTAAEDVGSRIGAAGSDAAARLGSAGHDLAARLDDATADLDGPAVGGAAVGSAAIGSAAAAGASELLQTARTKIGDTAAAAVAGASAASSRSADELSEKTMAGAAAVSAAAGHAAGQVLRHPASRTPQSPALSSPATPFTPDPVEPVTSSGSRGWLLPAIVIALLALGAWYFLRAGRADDVEIPAGSATASTVPPAASPAGNPPVANPPSDSAIDEASARPDGAASPAGGGGGPLDKATGATRNAARAVADASQSAARQVASGAKTVAVKTADVSKDVAGATARASKTAARETANVSKTVATKTAEGTKEGARATGNVAKEIGSATKTGAVKAAGAVSGAFGRVTGRKKSDANAANGGEPAAAASATAQGTQDAPGSSAATEAKAATDTASPGDPAATGGASASTGADVALPNGKSLRLSTGSASHQLAEYLQAPGPSGRTFVFEHLQFHSWTTKLTSSSQRTLRNLAAILEAYPSTEVRLDGYTDDKGKADANQQLSQARADAVRDLLGKQGVSVTRLATAGHGANNPIAANDTSSGRQRNRRIEVVVTKR